MSANATVATAAVISSRDSERGHRIRVFVLYLLAISLIVGLSVYGFSYYTLSSAERPFSPKHVLLRPSGSIGLKLGFLGFAIFLGIFLYPLRKAWPWLGQQGSARHWLDIHVMLGITAPFIIAFHSSFKFRGFAGIAFWIMVAVSLSGVIGRYLYSQIPRSLNAAELSMRELQELQEKLAQQLDQQNLLPQSDIRSLLKLPSQEQVDRMFAPISLVYMMILDLVRAFQIAKLRRHALSFGEQAVYLRRIPEDQEPRSGKSNLDGARRSGDCQACVVFEALAAGVPPVARGAQAIQLYLRASGHHSHRGSHDDGVLLESWIRS